MASRNVSNTFTVAGRGVYVAVVEGDHFEGHVVHLLLCLMFLRNGVIPGIF
jgi:hypothetical protein